jgi:hypothetical protein
MWPQRFEAGRPSRSFPAYRGQRNFTGWYWSATCRGHIPYESWWERDHLIRLDFDRATVAMTAQPFTLAWDDGVVGHLEHTPDFFVRRGDGTGLVVDVRPDERIGERDAVKFVGTRAACELVGWDYERVGAMEAVFTANLRWPAGFRHARVMREDTAAALGEVLAGGAGLLEGARNILGGYELEDRSDPLLQWIRDRGGNHNMALHFNRWEILTILFHEETTRRLTKQPATDLRTCPMPLPYY